MTHCTEIALGLMFCIITASVCQAMLAYLWNSASVVQQSVGQAAKLASQLLVKWRLRQMPICDLFPLCRHEGLSGMSHRWMKALPISYSLFSGMIGTQSVLFSKALSTLLRTTIDGDSQLDSWFFWLVLVLFLCCAYFWVTSLNKVSRLCEHIPLRHCC